MIKRDATARRLLRLKPAAEYLSVSPATLRGFVRREGLPVIRLAEDGHAPWLLDLRDLDDWIERTKTNGWSEVRCGNVLHSLPRGNSGGPPTSWSGDVLL
jgi:hypothetical protein